VAEIAKNTDLTKTEGAPSARADVTELPIESVEISALLGRGGGEVKFSVKADHRSELGGSLAVFPPVIAGCLFAGVLIVAGAPVWIVCCVLLVPIVIWRLRRNGGTPSR
jgi:hypothetical protein